MGPNPNTDQNTVERELAQMRRTLSLFKRIVYGVAGLAFVALIAWGSWTGYHALIKPKAAPDPVPTAIRQSAGFNLYYPVQTKLPVGYRLDTGSFNSNGQVVIYKVNYSGGTLVFSVQRKPSASQINLFYAHSLPLHLTVNTSVGAAAVGVLNQKTFVSLPTSSNAWIIVTGPANTDQARLKQVLQSLQLAH